MTSALARRFFMSCSVKFGHQPKSWLQPRRGREEIIKPVQEDDPMKYKMVAAARSSDNYSIFYDPLVQKFINVVLRKGKKDLATELIEKAFAEVKHIQVSKYHRLSEDRKHAIECNPYTIFHSAIENCKPVLWLEKIRKGGVLYDVPVPISERMREFRSMKFIIEAAKSKDRTVRFYAQLARELIAASNNQGKAIRRKQEFHQKCEANKAYAQFRW